MNVGYIRVSSVSQNADRQLDGVITEKNFEDKCSGSTTDRPQLKQCIEFIREGDTLHVHSIDRLARNLEDLLRLIRQITGKGVTLHFHKEGMSFSQGNSNPLQKLQLEVMGAVAEFERCLILERQREGIAIAKAQGKYKGGKRKKIVEFESKYKDYKNRIIPSKTALAKELKISRPTLDRRIKEYEQK